MSLTWLHLTDLHIGQTDQEHLFPTIKHKFWEDIEKYTDDERAGRIDLILFSGDLVQRGSVEEFGRFEELMLDVRERLAPGALFLPVPGNHDLVRPKAADSAVAGLMQLWGSPTTEDGSVQDLFWTDASSSQRRVVETALANYLDWWKGSALNPANAVPGVESRVAISDYVASGLLPGDFRITITKDGIRLGVMGLNTTFLQLKGGDLKGKLSVGLPQVTRLCPDPVRWVQGHHLAFLMTHQPPDWMTARGLQDLLNEINPPGRFALHLMGHMHEGVASSQSYGNSPERRLFQGRSWFGLEYIGDRAEPNRQSRSHGYALGRIDWDASMLRLRIWPRAFERVSGAGYVAGADRQVGVLRDESHLRYDVTPNYQVAARRLNQSDIDYFASHVYPMIRDRLPPADVRPVAYLQARLRDDVFPPRHCYVVEASNEAVGVLYCRDDRAGDCVFISYLVAKKPEAGHARTGVTELLLRELRQLVQNTGRKYLLMELAHPGHVPDRSTYIESISRMKLFAQFAGHFGFEILALDADYLQPPLGISTTAIPHLLAIGRKYVGGHARSMSRQDAAAIVQAAYGGYMTAGDGNFVTICTGLRDQAIANLGDPVMLMGYEDVQQRWP